MKKWLDKYQSKGEVKKGVYQYTPQNLTTPNFNGLAATTYDVTPTNNMLPEVVIKAKRIKPQANFHLNLQNQIFANNTRDKVLANKRKYYYPYETEQTKNIRDLAGDLVSKSSGDLISSVHPIGAIINALAYGADESLPLEGIRYLPNNIPFKQAKTYNNLIPILKPLSKFIDPIQMFNKLHIADSLYNSADSIDLYNQFKEGGLTSKNSLNRKVTCSNCGWSWKLSDGGMDPMTCHKCGGDIKIREGGELDQYQDKGQVNFRDQLFQRNTPIVDKTAAPIFRPVVIQPQYLENSLAKNPKRITKSTYTVPVIKQGYASTPYSKALRNQRNDEYFRHKTMQNSDLAKTFASFTPGNNIEAGVIGAETFANLNPVMSGPILATSRLAPAILHPTNNQYWGADKSVLQNALGVLGAVGDVAMFSPYVKGLKVPKPNSVSSSVDDVTPTFKSEIDWENWVKYKEDFHNNPEVIKHLNDIEEVSKANGTWMKNPDGSPFEGTPEQFVTQQSDNFKKMQGIINNKKNVPRLNYHYSDKDFNIFDEKFFKQGRFGKGIYTGLNPNLLNKGRIVRGNNLPPTDFTKRYSLYQRSTNPQTSYNDVHNRITELHENIQKIYSIPYGKKIYSKKLKNYIEEIDKLRNQSLGINPITKEFDREHAIHILKDNYTSLDINHPTDPYYEMVVPFSNYPKSAEGNILFDITNPDMYKAYGGQWLDKYQSKGEVKQSFRDQLFERNKPIVDKTAAPILLPTNLNYDKTRVVNSSSRGLTKTQLKNINQNLRNRAEQEKKQELEEYRAAQLFHNNNPVAQFLGTRSAPVSSVKPTARELAYGLGAGINEFYDIPGIGIVNDFVNPLSVVSKGMISPWAQAPLQAQQSDSYLPYLGAAASTALAIGDVAMFSPYVKGLKVPKPTRGLPRVLSEGQPYEGAPHIYEDMVPINGRYQPRTVITDAGVKDEILGLEATPVIPLNQIEYPVTSNKFLYGPHNTFGKMEPGVVNNTTTPTTQQSILNKIFPNSSKSSVDDVGRSLTQAPYQAGFFNFKGAFQKYPKGPLTKEEIIAYRNSPEYQQVTKEHLDAVKKYGDKWKLGNYAEDALQEAIATGKRNRINLTLYGGRNWGAVDYVIAGLAGTAYPGYAGIMGLSFSPPAVRNKVLNKMGITSTPGGLSSRDTTIDITNRNMDFAKVNETKDGQIIIGGEFIEDANNTVRKAKDWLNATDTYSDKEYPSKDIQSFYGIENGKFKVGKALDFNPETEIVPRRFGAININKAVMNNEEMRLLDKDGNPIYQNTPNTGKFILYSPSTGKAQFTYINTGKSGVDKVNNFLKKNKDAQYIHLDNGRYEYYGINPEGLTEQDFKNYYEQDLKREGNPGYNLIVKQTGGPIITNRGQWDYPGQTTIIPSNKITMQGVPYPVIGVDNTGHTKMMQPGMDYTFPGQYVTEYPMMQGGGIVDKLFSTLNPYNWGVEDYTNKGDFNKAYSSAKKAGEQEFMYKGKRYNTKYAGTPRQEVGTYGVNGQPVHPMDLNHPAQVNLYPAFGQYLPGHISASIGDNETSIDYSSMGNFPYGINAVKNKGEKSFNVYGQDNLTFSNKAASLPTGEYVLEDKYTPSDWNLFTNNCADNVCDAFGIPRSKGIQTPAGAISKIKEKYPTLDITGRTYEDYHDLVDNINKRANYKNLTEKEYITQRTKNVLNNSNKLISVYFSPDTNKQLKEKIGETLQKALINSGYDLPKSYIKGNKYNLDKIIGNETMNALKNWQGKNQKQPKYENGGTLAKDFIMMQSGGQMIKRADGSYSRPGLWDNIRANAGSGKKPTAQMLEQERKIRNKYQGGGSAYDQLLQQNKPTTTDSLNLYNNALSRIKFYSQNPDYKKMTIEDQVADFIKVTKDSDKKSNIKKKESHYKNLGDSYKKNILKKNASAHNMNDMAFKQFNNLSKINTIKNKTYNKGTPTNEIEYRKNINDFQYYQKELEYGTLNLDAPPQLYDRRIEPSTKSKYRYQGKENLVDNATIFEYDPIVVKPSHMKTLEDWTYLNKTYNLKIPDNFLIQNPSLPVSIDKPQQINVPQQDIPKQQGTPVYGPGNTIIGYSNNMQFTPALQYTGAPNNEFNLQDKALLDNPELLKQYIYNRNSGYHYQDGGEEDVYWRTKQPMVNDPSMDAISKVLLQRNQDKNFMQRAAGFGNQNGIPTRYIDEEDPNSNDMSTLLMGFGDNYVSPTIIETFSNPLRNNSTMLRTAPGQLIYQPDQMEEYIKTPTEDIADYFATKGYKRAANDMYGMKYQEGGEEEVNNLKNINLNLPVYRKPEMNPLQFNKFLVNDRNQNLFIGGVNPRYQNENFSVGPYMIGVGNKYFQKFPADIGVSGTYHVNDNFDINMGVGQNNINAGIKYKFNNGGYVVRRSNDRKGKTHVVTGPDGTKKYFGDPNMGERSKSKYGKEAFYARHKSNLAKNPYFRAYARTTWQEGGQIMAIGGQSTLNPIVKKDNRNWLDYLKN